MLSNPKTIINDQDAPQEVKKQVIRADQLVETIKRMNRESSELKSSMKDLKEDGEYYLNKMHIEKPITYIEKFKQEELEDQPAAERPAPAPLEGKCCPKCGKPSCGRPDAVRMSAKNSGAAQDFLNVIL